MYRNLLSGVDSALVAPPLDFGRIEVLAGVFRERLAVVKREINPADYGWYPYDSFSSIAFLSAMLREGEHRFLLELAGKTPILDLGCGDGDLAFFFEALGRQVCAIDHPAANQNAMFGVAALRAALNSGVEGRAVDLDTQFSLQSESYDLAICLGVLYHLKNPFYVLETLARHARYCVLSTRIAERTPRGSKMKAEPLAYLVASDELNADPSNY